ncbi:hypothetical protein KIN20_026983 [Parelaphostrongylus tenuis]|uniref:Uncharacterized protein n=1 Tax=Parelaphostrongylus tenuis TaxID=148309 RepID=A0AAD5QYQ3_PARTN|nr:hypothetical protein KIN20_026983 [Parelaphostrongylus tenuis]
MKNIIRGIQQQHPFLTEKFRMVLRTDVFDSCARIVNLTPNITPACFWPLWVPRGVFGSEFRNPTRCSSTRKNRVLVFRDKRQTRSKIHVNVE